MPTVEPTTAAAHLRINDVFISYSRRDKGFVQQLDAAFRQIQRDPWVDWDDIRKGEDWWRSIQRGIEGADTFVFVVSPDSVASAVCRDEVDYATELNKRFLPIVWREGFDMAQVHPSIARHNWLFFRAEDDFEAAFQDLVEALETDLDHVHAHTRLLLRSREWHSQHQDASYLLRGRDLQDAQAWLAAGLGKTPQPTPDQVAYINASVTAQQMALKARQKARWVVLLTTVLANLAFVGAGFLWMANQLINDAYGKVQRNMEETLQAVLTQLDGDAFETLVDIARDAPTESSAAALAQIDPYAAHQAKLATAAALTPVGDLFTYAPGPSANEFVVIGDVHRDRPGAEGFGAAPYSFGEVVPLAQLDEGDQRLVAGLQQVTPDLFLESGRQGNAWIAIYGPITNSAGQKVGALALQYEASYVTEVASEIRAMMIAACIGALVWFTLSSILILRVTRPPQGVLPASRPPQPGAN